MTMTIQNVEEAKKTIKTNDIVLFMKGSSAFPQCGFSAAVVQVLSQIGADYKDVNVLESDEMRQGIKDFTGWPTIPQLYVKGEFIGGCDIVREMYENGELEAFLKDKGVAKAALITIEEQFQAGVERRGKEIHGTKVGITICEDIWNDKVSFDLDLAYPVCDRQSVPITFV